MQAGSWVTNKHALYDILTPVCGRDEGEVCLLDLSNKLACLGTLGLLAPLNTISVTDIQDGTSVLAFAKQGDFLGFQSANRV